MNDTRRKIYQQIREYNRELADALETIDKIPLEPKSSYTNKLS